MQSRQCLCSAIFKLNFKKYNKIGLNNLSYRSVALASRPRFSHPRPNPDNTTMSFSSLPYEIQRDILRYVIDVQPAKHVLPCVNSAWQDITLLPIIHSHFFLQSREQLLSFSRHSDVDELESGSEPKSSLLALGIKTRTRTTLEHCVQGRTFEIRGFVCVWRLADDLQGSQAVRASTEVGIYSNGFVIMRIIIALGLTDNKDNIIDVSEHLIRLL